MNLPHCIEQFLLDCERRRLRPATVISYRDQLYLYARWLGARELSEGPVGKYLDYLRDRNLSSASVADAFTVLRLFGNWLCESQLIEQPLTAGLRKPEVERQLPRRATIDAYQALLHSIPLATWLDRRDYLIVQSLFMCGLRVGEVCALRTDSIDVKAGLLRVEDGKTGSSVLPLLDEIAASYIDYMTWRPASDCPWLFPRSEAGGLLMHNEALKPNGIRLMLRRRCRYAGIDYLNPHSFRHGFAIYLLNEKKVEMSIVQRLLRHESITTTAKFYAEWQLSALRDVYSDAIGG